MLAALLRPLVRFNSILQADRHERVHHPIRALIHVILDTLRGSTAIYGDVRLDPKYLLDALLLLSDLRPIITIAVAQWDLL